MGIMDTEEQRHRGVKSVCVEVSVLVGDLPRSSVVLPAKLRTSTYRERRRDGDSGFFFCGFLGFFLGFLCPFFSFFLFFSCLVLVCELFFFLISFSLFFKFFFRLCLLIADFGIFFGFQDVVCGRQKK